jgi:hypothetical protein
MMPSDAAPAGDAWQTERRWLGYAGLAPFLACAAVLLLADEPAWRRVAMDTLRDYAAVIASFLGAVHWGMAAQRNDAYVRARLHWGVTPALIAWVLLAVEPARIALLGFAALFVLILIVDRFLMPVLDATYRELRVRLSVIVVVSLLVAALAGRGLV